MVNASTGKPEDFVIPTGETYSVREFIELSFKEIGIDIVWQGHGINEIGIDAKTNKTLVQVDPKYFRPAEVALLIGDASKAESKLKWKRNAVFKDLVKMMVESDINELKS
jgi:GDPmannose 4,6-dehydratase